MNNNNGDHAANYLSSLEVPKKGNATGGGRDRVRRSDLASDELKEADLYGTYKNAEAEVVFADNALFVRSSDVNDWMISF